MRKIIFAFIVPLFFSCNNGRKINTPVAQDDFAAATPSPHQNLEPLAYKIFKNDTVKADIKIAGFGYDIYQNNILFIHQPTIPAVQGNKGFSTAAKAGKAASLVLHKLQNNILPPAVSIHELDSIGVLQ